MKKLHLLTSTDSLRQKYNFIQVKDGHVTATDCFKCAKFPFSEVFGKLETELNEFYISGENWKKCKFHTALRFEIENGYLIGYDKKGKLGICEILTREQFIQLHGEFPSTDFLFNDIAESEQVCSISFSPELLFDLCQAIGGQAFNYIFYGNKKKIIVESKYSEVKACIMPSIY